MEIIYDKVNMPVPHGNYLPVDITAGTMEEHRQKVLRKMEECGLDVLVVYADREHGANYAYLTGFEPRFEESILVLHKDGTCCMMLGNENLKMGRYSLIQGKIIHVPHFSLPYQPMEPLKDMTGLVEEAGIQDGMTIGCAGWKHFTSKCKGEENLLDIPAFIADALRKINLNGILRSASGIFLDSRQGLRTRVNANEIAHYEFGAGMASVKVLEAMNEIRPGKLEMEIAGHLSAYGQPTTVTTICAAGERFTNAVVFPRNKPIQKGDRISITFGLRGGLTSRAAYVGEDRTDLPKGEQGYVEEVAIPYYKAAVTWYEMIGIGVSCAKIYETIEEVLPKERFHWSLNPGHYTGADEWTASPIYPGSEVKLESGMMLQMDIIPSVPGYGGIGAEDGIAIADQDLRNQIQERYPAVWERIKERREYMKNSLGIVLKEEILPMSDLCGYLRPLILNKEYALRKKQ